MFATTKKGKVFITKKIRIFKRTFKKEKNYIIGEGNLQVFFVFEQWSLIKDHQEKWFCKICWVFDMLGVHNQIETELILHRNSSDDFRD